VTFGFARTFLTHCDSPRVDTRYLAVPTSTVITGTFCGSLLPRLVTVSVSLSDTPVAIAILLKILTVNQGGLRYAMATKFDGRHATTAMAGPVQPARDQSDPADLGRLGTDNGHPRACRTAVRECLPHAV